ncbi:MAG TPA: biosynthetic arginine decarboxylase [Pseudomonadales bacterium]|nr:biosynthetic arginine decarboxylase [Pseudomonadales bacterium]
MSSQYIEQSLTRYNIRRWSEGYYDINENGALTVALSTHDKQFKIPLVDIQQAARQSGLSLPLLLRFKGVLRDRVQALRLAFADTLHQEGHVSARYLPVYPIKVNQQRSVVEEIAEASLASGGQSVGLECGSKPELMAVMGLLCACVNDNPAVQPTIICNGYKDEDYLRMALIGEQMGLNVYIVIEKLAELEAVLALAAEMQITPRLGLRVRLSSIGKGKWQNSGGEKSKFGLTASHLLSALEMLKARGYADSLKLMHFHIGSQIANIHDVQQGLREAGHYYSDIIKLGFNLEWLDVGGGLGVDYEGSCSRRFCSMNYDINEYARNIVHTLSSLCQQQGVPFPNLITEAGRAMSAHHAVLVCETFGAEQLQSATLAAPTADSPELLHSLWRNLQKIQTQSDIALELYHAICSDFNEVCEAYVHGLLNLRQRAQAECFYHAALLQLLQKMQGNSRARLEIIEEIKEKAACKLFVNFSIFRSLPDIWGIDQVFPIAPLQHLDQPLCEHVVIQDVTCDSDGRIDQYVDGEDLESSLPVAKLNSVEGALYGFFLVGAYQEILGDNHNLFGETDTVDVEVDAQGKLLFSHAEKGDTIASVLDSVHFSGEQLLASYERRLARLELPSESKNVVVDTLRACMAGSPYLI